MGRIIHTENTYDARLRLASVSAKLDNGSTATQAFTYDNLQRTATVNRGGGMETTQYDYTLQGWLSSASSATWEETLRYQAPVKSGTDALPGKVGLVTEWVMHQMGTSSGGMANGDTYTFSYDKAGRLTGSLRYANGSSSSTYALTERSITYDRSGNLLTLSRYGTSGSTPSESLSFSYTGPKRSGWTYDSHGNVTADPKAGVSIAYNVLDMPRTLQSGSAGTERSYLSDGTLARVGDGTTTRLYLGDMVFLQTSSGTSLESAGWEGGRLLSGTGTDKVLYYVTDHLGSTRVVKDGGGNVRQRFDYYPYGSVSKSWTSSGTTDYSEKRFRFGGKEIAGTSLTDLSGIGPAPGASYLDFGARLYSPGSAAWLTQDPLAEKYYPITPYGYCAGSPVILIDSTGYSPVYGSDGTYRGNTIEGFTNSVIIYDGDKPFSEMSAPELLYDDSLDLTTLLGDANDYDVVRNRLSNEAKSKIWTHIVSQMEGAQIYDEVFSLSTISGGIIQFSSDDGGGWFSSILDKTIFGTDRYSYETTVENIQSSVIVHEWYSHIMKGNHDFLKSHRLAYKNVINYKALWNNTTDQYKSFYLKELLIYTKSETGRTKIDPPYRNLYKKYVE